MDETTVDARFIHGRIKSGGQVMQGKRPGLIMVLMASIGLALPQFPAGAQLLGPVERTVGGLADTVTDTLSSGLVATERLTEDARDLTRTRLRGLLRRSEEHTSELQSLMRISYAVFCLQKKKILNKTTQQV